MLQLSFCTLHNLFVCHYAVMVLWRLTTSQLTVLIILFLSSAWAVGHRLRWLLCFLPCLLSSGNMVIQPILIFFLSHDIRNCPLRKSVKSSASFQWMKAPNSRLCEFTGVTLVSKRLYLGPCWWQGLNGCLFITF